MMRSSKGRPWRVPGWRRTSIGGSQRWGIPAGRTWQGDDSLVADDSWRRHGARVPAKKSTRQSIEREPREEVEEEG